MNKNSIANRGFYATLKGKRKKFATREMYATLAGQIAAAQFDYKTPDFNKSLYEQSIMCGLAAFYKVPKKVSSVNGGKWCCTPAFIADTPDNDGISKKITTYGTDYALELEVNKDCVLIRNNSLHTPENYIGVIADMLTETDISTLALLKWSRMTPIPKAKTEEQRVLFVEAMKRVIDGEEITAVSDPMALFNDGHCTIDDNMLRLTDEQAINKMHFYSEFYEQAVRRICTLRGIPFSSTAKSSQNLNDELHDMDIFAELYIKDCYETRKEDFKRAGEFADFDFGFDWSETMKRQFAKNELQMNENVPAKNSTESEGEKNDVPDDNAT